MRILVIACLMAALPAAAETAACSCAPRGTVISLDAQAARDVANDLMRVSYFVESEDADPARLASGVNRAASEALAIAKQLKDAKVQSGGYNTYPVRDKSNKIVRWRSRVDFSVEGKDFRELSELTAKLQSTVQVAGIGFSVSRETRAKAEDALIQEAVAAFQGRAAVAAKAAGIAAYVVREMAVQTEGCRPPMPVQRMAAAEAIPAPSLEAGMSSITVRVTGAIESPPGPR
ncbi:MAG TPA: SIMPL domain-containing protein [Burkholderiales bacterium]|nr:SIMPL domain-containing protein [Burkholderiales bacterium]